MSLLSILLQIDTVATAADAVAKKEEISLWYLLMQGGVLMIPLLICSVLLVYVFAERLMAIKRASSFDPTFMSRIREHVTDGNLQAAKSLAKNTQGPIARMIDKGLSRIGKPIDHIEKSMENAGKLEVYQLEKNVSMLSTIAGIAPMFGFLGTIAGMIILFFNIQHQGFSIEGIASGIYTKMVTSAVGLIIGLLAYVAYNYLNAQINKNVNRMESAAVEFLDILHEPAK
ncbi:MAG: MotA/TolQ/ExbB proton channel family protein [Chitinophagales bacterium]|nr:MotA/TolQ/ExbB proton channel family protein [Chitinophagales bacterium]